MTRSPVMQRLVVRRLPPRRLGGALVPCAALLCAALGAVLAGCGDSGGTPTTATSPADDFVGTWRYLDVQSVLQCPGADPMNQPPDPNKTLAHGIGAAIVDLSPSPLLLLGVFCDIGFDVAGAVATAQPNQTCALTSLDSLSIDQPAGGAPLWTFTLNSATTAEELATATAHFLVSGAVMTCSWTLVGHLTRVTKD